MDPFTTLGLPRRYDLDRNELERRYRDLQQALHPDKFSAASASERQMNLRKAVEVNEAYRTLRDDAKRAELLLAAVGGGGRGEPVDPELLMEMMELRETLAEARAAQASERVAELAKQVREGESEVRSALIGAFARLEKDRAPAAISGARELVGRLRYYRRFLDE